jgi:ABC-2 type transport system permease protein
MENTRQKLRNRHITTAILVLLGILLLNLLAQKKFFRVDLTSEKRYTLSDDTKKILSNLNDVVFVRIYLEGNLNIPLKQFQKNILELLDEFRIYAGNRLQYELIDPFAGADPSLHQKIEEDLMKKGLKPTNIHITAKDGTVTDMMVVPGAIIAYKGSEVPLDLLMNNRWKSSEENLNNSIETLEYSFISTIKNITAEKINKIAFIQGQGEFPQVFVGDIMKDLSKSFQIDFGTIHGTPGILDPYKAIVIAGPVKAFTEADKFVIDQYVMKGGKVLWLLDGANVDFDSLANGQSIALPNNVNLDDMLFRYGVRINPDLVEDAQCNQLPVNVALAGNTPNFQPAPWMYYPVIVPSDRNEITQKTNLILLRFVSPIDTIAARKEVKKIPLLITSQVCRIRKVPAVINLAEISMQPDPKTFNSPNRLVGILLQGKFESVFKNRMLSGIIDSVPDKVLSESVETKMIVISDADIIRNDIRNTAKGTSIIPLGYDRFTDQTFGNKDFLINAISYLANEMDLLKLRGREFQLRLLDKHKISSERMKWQLINILLPVILLVIFAVAYHFIRKFKYTL